MKVNFIAASSCFVRVTYLQQQAYERKFIEYLVSIFITLSLAFNKT